MTTTQQTTCDHCEAEIESGEDVNYVRGEMVCPACHPRNFADLDAWLKHCDELVSIDGDNTHEQVRRWQAAMVSMWEDYKDE